ncbi:hypothetical protein CKA32_004938 [Geitlerinema sp. FC II]|nr:hypothetical protein CKA32_004938 [Geitlerinema sp. FC II]
MRVICYDRSDRVHLLPQSVLFDPIDRFAPRRACQIRSN